MKFCRFVPKSAGAASRVLPAYGLIEGEIIHSISGPPWQPWSRESATLPLREARLLAPVEPTKIVGVGRNYAAHAAELGNEVPKEPLIFLKPPSALVGPDSPIVLTSYSKQVEHEGELAVVIGKNCSRLNESEDPLSYVLGYACLNDVTARDLQKSDVQFARAKGFDTFCPIGPYIESQLDPRDALVETRVNGQLRQSGQTSLLIYPVAYLIRWISRMMTLLPGDVITTGTPAGVGPLVAGDYVEVSVSGIGVLHNPVYPPAS
ncbi:MAG TPA: fumarylacetoacetate hydrolase family protein [Candidatus Eisenbacteria bacterium]|nr:fumarylacetoacetate hydrolase family protein [Candidatus Eisenbacteria bacterium]